MKVCQACPEVIKIPEGKKVEYVQYTDGSADIVLDVPNDIMSEIYKCAHLWNCTAEEAATRMVTEGLESILKEEKENQKKDCGLKCKCKSKKTKTKKNNVSK